MLTGSISHPALTTEGDAVKVQLADASVMVTVTGPDVPGEGLPYDAPSTTCTFTLTFSQATAAVPITLTDFTTLDHLGAIDHPQPIPGQVQPPAAVRPGQTVTFKLRMIMRAGEGLLRWAPGGSPTSYASWDFEVETD